MKHILYCVSSLTASAALFRGAYAGIPRSRPADKPYTLPGHDLDASPGSEEYLVLYKNGIGKEKRDLHELFIHERATNRSRTGVKRTFEIGDRHVYHIDIPHDDLDDYIHNSGYVRFFHLPELHIIQLSAAGLNRY